MDGFLDTQTVLSILSNSFNTELYIRGSADGLLYRVVGAEVNANRVVLQMAEIPVALVEKGKTDG